MVDLNGALWYNTSLYLYYITKVLKLTSTGHYGI